MIICVNENDDVGNASFDGSFAGDDNDDISQRRIIS
jgi:hypothetical protein